MVLGEIWNAMCVNEENSTLVQYDLSAIYPVLTCFNGLYRAIPVNWNPSLNPTTHILTLRLFFLSLYSICCSPFIWVAYALTSYVLCNCYSGIS